MVLTYLGAKNQVGASSGGTPDWTLIQSVDVTSPVSSVTFTSIPTTYLYLKVRLMARSEYTTGNTDQILMRFNNDSSSNYLTAGAATTSVAIGSAPISTSASSQTNFTFFETTYLNHATSKKIPMIVFYNYYNNPAYGVTNTSLITQQTWNNVSTNITTWLLYLTSAANFVAGSKFTLYGSVR